MTQQEIRNLRDMIDGELNRIAVSKDEDEVDRMYEFLKQNVDKYYQANKINRFESPMEEANLALY